MEDLQNNAKLMKCCVMDLRILMMEMEAKLTYLVPTAGFELNGKEKRRARRQRQSYVDDYFPISTPYEPRESKESEEHVTDKETASSICTQSDDAEIHTGSRSLEVEENHEDDFEPQKDDWNNILSKTFQQHPGIKRHFFQHEQLHSVDKTESCRFDNDVISSSNENASDEVPVDDEDVENKTCCSWNQFCDNQDDFNAYESSDTPTSENHKENISTANNNYIHSDSNIQDIEEEIDEANDDAPIKQKNSQEHELNDACEAFDDHSNDGKEIGSLNPGRGNNCNHDISPAKELFDEPTSEPIENKKQPKQHTDKSFILVEDEDDGGKYKESMKREEESNCSSLYSLHDEPLNSSEENQDSKHEDELKECNTLEVEGEAVEDNALITEKVSETTGLNTNSSTVERSDQEVKEENGTQLCQYADGSSVPTPEDRPSDSVDAILIQKNANLNDGLHSIQDECSDVKVIRGGLHPTMSVVTTDTTQNCGTLHDKEKCSNLQQSPSVEHSQLVDFANEECSSSHTIKSQMISKPKGLADVGCKQDIRTLNSLPQKDEINKQEMDYTHFEATNVDDPETEELPMRDPYVIDVVSFKESLDTNNSLDEKIAFEEETFNDNLQSVDKRNSNISEDHQEICIKDNDESNAKEPITEPSFHKLELAEGVCPSIKNSITDQKEQSLLEENYEADSRQNHPEVQEKCLDVVSEMNRSVSNSNSVNRTANVKTPLQTKETLKKKFSKLLPPVRKKADTIVASNATASSAECVKQSKDLREVAAIAHKYEEPPGKRDNRDIGHFTSSHRVNEEQSDIAHVPDHKRFKTKDDKTRLLAFPQLTAVARSKHKTTITEDNGQKNEHNRKLLFVPDSGVIGNASFPCKRTRGKLKEEISSPLNVQQEIEKTKDGSKYKPIVDENLDSPTTNDMHYNNLPIPLQQLGEIDDNSCMGLDESRANDDECTANLHDDRDNHHSGWQDHRTQQLSIKDGSFEKTVFVGESGSVRHLQVGDENQILVELPDQNPGSDSTIKVVDLHKHMIDGSSTQFDDFDTVEADCDRVETDGDSTCSTSNALDNSIHVLFLRILWNSTTSAITGVLVMVLGKTGMHVRDYSDKKTSQKNEQSFGFVYGDDTVYLDFKKRLPRDILCSLYIQSGFANRFWISLFKLRHLTERNWFIPWQQTMQSSTPHAQMPIPQMFNPWMNLLPLQCKNNDYLRFKIRFNMALIHALYESAKIQAIKIVTSHVNNSSNSFALFGNHDVQEWQCTRVQQTPSDDRPVHSESQLADEAYIVTAYDELDIVNDDGDEINDGEINVDGYNHSSGFNENLFDETINNFEVHPDIADFHCIRDRLGDPIVTDCPESFVPNTICNGSSLHVVCKTNSADLCPDIDALSSSIYHDLLDRANKLVRQRLNNSESFCDFLQFLDVDVCYISDSGECCLRSDNLEQVIEKLCDIEENIPELLFVILQGLELGEGVCINQIEDVHPIFELCSSDSL